MRGFVQAAWREGRLAEVAGYESVDLGHLPKLAYNKEKIMLQYKPFFVLKIQKKALISP